ncbi:ArsR family transcriptional regulator [Longispora fulva]|uniref:Putative ArsR family transcriptional regulator n=1 Tax=Longispora fulva TaxID=619741 RepID=A0A8J7KG23_9ACTN|nr:helix-turn-helix domain-containing protein [Longispora fulva]MBG6136875.1 putative ArsR family transcriptional regulator [Longispora fulva]GIG60046.1 ArsR family transcriptional regulator [Longispora fulva]
MITAWEATAVLVDPVRRALYDHVRAVRVPVNREDAASAVGVSRSLAAFHLDKLVDAGLLAARHEAPLDRPRARGRAPKVYEPSGVEVSLTIPERRYELLGDILAEAVARQPHDAADAARRIAHRHGAGVGEAARPTPVVAVLAGLGFEPAEDAGGIVLRNCPFHRLAVRETDLVCGINLCFVAGMLDGLGETGREARLDRGPDTCCVRVTGC